MSLVATVTTCQIAVAAAQSSPLKVLTFIPKLLTFLTHWYILFPLFGVFVWWIVFKRGKGGKGKKG